MTRSRKHRFPISLLLLLLILVAALSAVGFYWWNNLRPTPATPPSAPVPEYTDSGVDFLVLVNGDHPLPEDWTVELTELSNGQQVASAMYPALQLMFDDARAQGVYPIVASGYRTAEKQQSLMDERIAQYISEGYSEEEAVAEAALWVNPVGCSEHQTGLAVDINADGVHSYGYEVYDWLAVNAWQYGFILRYPEGETEITGTDYEPWHYRYVGLDAAKDVHKGKLTLEEYLGAP